MNWPELTLVEGPCPLEGCPDLTAILKKVMVPGSILPPEDFNANSNGFAGNHPSAALFPGLFKNGSRS